MVFNWTNFKFWISKKFKIV